MLVLGIALAWAGPARAARALETERGRIAAMLASADEQRIDAALAEASRRAATPEDFAAEVVRALASRPGDGHLSRTTDALLKALFGRILQAMALSRTAPAVIVAPQLSDGPVPQVAIETPAVRSRPAPAGAWAFTAFEGVTAPALARPAIQSQGP